MERSKDLLSAETLSQTPMFTILTASFNSSRTIERTIQSVKNQTFRDFEHIIMDGGSTDGTAQIIEKHAPDYPVAYRSEKDCGIADALNKGIALAKGRFVIVIHADDHLIANDILERVSQDIKDGEALIHSYPVLVERPDRSTRPYFVKPWSWMHRFKTFFPHQGCFVRRDVFETVGIFDISLRFAFDFDFFARCFNHKISYRVHPAPFVSVMMEGGISSDVRLLRERVLEEFKVQKKNESGCFWAGILSVYQFLYFPFKTKLLNRNKE